MSQENVDFVKGLFAAGSEMDKEALLAALPELIAQACDPEIVWVQNPNAPDPRTYRGHDGMREFREELGEAFEDVRLDADRFIDAGNQVVVLGSMRARGVGSGVEVREARGWLWTLRDGKVVRHQTYDGHEAALEAAGLSE